MPTYVQYDLSQSLVTQSKNNFWSMLGVLPPILDRSNPDGRSLRMMQYNNHFTKVKLKKMKKIQYFPRLNEVRNDRCEKTILEPDMTVPNQTMSLRQIVDRFRAGQQIPIGKNIYYDGNPTFDDFNPIEDREFDLVDYSEKLEEIKQRRKTEQNAKQKADASQPDQQGEKLTPVEVTGEA